MKASRNYSEAKYLIQDTKHGHCRGIRSVAKGYIRKMHRAQKALAIEEAWLEAEEAISDVCTWEYQYHGCGCCGEGYTDVDRECSMAWADWQKAELVGELTDDQFAKHMQVETLWHNHEIDVKEIEDMQKEVDKYNYEEPWYADDSWEVDEWDFEFEGAFPRLVRSSTPDYVDEFRRRKVLEELAWIFGEFDMNAE